MLLEKPGRKMPQREAASRVRGGAPAAPSPPHGARGPAPPQARPRRRRPSGHRGGGRIWLARGTQLATTRRGRTRLPRSSPRTLPWSRTGARGHSPFRIGLRASCRLSVRRAGTRGAGRRQHLSGPREVHPSSDWRCYRAAASGQYLSLRAHPFGASEPSAGNTDRDLSSGSGPQAVTDGRAAGDRCDRSAG